MSDEAFEDQDVLRSGLRTLTADQPWAPDRVAGVIGRVRRRRQQRLAASGGALAVVGLAAAIVLVTSGPEREPQPARPDPGTLAGLTWEPRGELADDADGLAAAVAAWQPDRPDAPARVLFAGGLSALRPGPDTGSSADRFYVVQGPVGSVQRLAVLRDRDGDGPAPFALLVDEPAPRPTAAQVTVLLTEVPSGSDEALWPGKDGADLRSLLLVLPRPGAETVTALLYRPDTSSTFRRLPTGPSLTEVETPVPPVGLVVDGSRTPRAELPLVDPPVRLRLPPPVLPDGAVPLLESVGTASVTGEAFTEQVQVLVRCTTRGGPLRLAVETSSTAYEAEGVCDGQPKSVVGIIEPEGDTGVSNPRLPAGDGFGLLFGDSPGVDQVSTSVVALR